MEAVDLDAVADELYGLRPEEFTVVRDRHAAAARAAGDRELADRIKALRRPTLAAWASNLLVREQPEAVEPLVRLGEGLRRAHEELDGAQLRELSRRQHTLVAALTRQAGSLTAAAGHRVGGAVQEEIEQTLRAVLADPEAAREWATGRLARPLSAAPGFRLGDTRTQAQTQTHLTLVPPVSRERGKAAERRTPDRRPPEPSAAERKAAGKRRRTEERRRRESAEAREAAERAAEDLRGREADAEQAERAAGEAADRAARLRRRVGELADALRGAEADVREAEGAEREARVRAREAERGLRDARRRARVTATHLARLTPDDG